MMNGPAPVARWAWGLGKQQGQGRWLLTAICLGIHASIQPFSLHLLCTRSTSVLGMHVGQIQTLWSRNSGGPDPPGFQPQLWLLLPACW